MASKPHLQLEGITSLAILKVNWDERHEDYLEGFMPFVAECLREAPADEVAQPDIQQALSKLVGYVVPLGVVKTLLKRAHQRGFVTIVNKIYRRNLEKLGPSEMVRKVSELQRKCQALLAHLQTYVRDQFDLEWSEEEADEALFGYVRSVAVPVVQAARHGVPLQLQTNGHGPEHADYVVSAFIQRLHKQEPTYFEYLEDVAKGSMLASVLYYENPNVVRQRFEGVNVYFDTPFLLSAIGVNGAEMEAPCLELFALLEAQEVGLRVFRHTVDEMQGVLDAHARSPRSRRAIRVPTVAAPIQTWLSSSDLRLLADSLDDRLRRLGMRIEEKPHFDDRFTLDERKLDDMLQSSINYARDDTRTHDAEALMAIYRLRRGRLPARIEQSVAVFVTTNSKLVRTSRDFFVAQRGSRANDAPISLLHDDLATRLWLKTPNAAPDLPSRQLIAHSYAALLPGEDLIDRYLAEIERLRQNESLTGDEYLYMRSADAVYRALADATLNDPDAFTEATVEEVRRRAEAEARAETEERLCQEETARKRAEKEAEEAKARADKEAEDRRREVLRSVELQREADEATEQAKREKGRRNQTENHLRGLAGTAGSIVRWGFRILLFIPLAVAVVIPIVAGFPNEAKGWWLYALLIATAVGGIQQLVTAFLDVASWSQRIAGNVEERMMRKLLPPDELEDTTSNQTHEPR